MVDATFVAAASDLELSGDGTTFVAVVAGIGVVALLFAALFRSQVLAANEGARATYEQLGFRPRLLELEKSLTP